VRVELAELGLAALDALDVEALALHVGPERPLQGLAGYADWRLCGALSRLIRGGTYDPDHGEALLVPSDGRLRVRRIFCFGVRPALDRAGLAAASMRLCTAMAKAGSRAYATSLPPHAPERAAEAARAWLEATLPRPVDRQVLLGDTRTLYRDLTAARDALGTKVEIVLPVQRVELPVRAGSLPPHGAVVR
jgi:hypothetical protein